MIIRVPSGDEWPERLCQAFREAQDGDEIRSCSIATTVDVQKAIACAEGRNVTYAQELGWEPYRKLPVLSDALLLYVGDGGKLVDEVRAGLEEELFDDYLGRKPAGFDFWGEGDAIAVLVKDSSEPVDYASLTNNIRAATNEIHGVLVVTRPIPGKDLSQAETVAGKLVMYLEVV